MAEHLFRKCFTDLSYRVVKVVLEHEPTLLYWEPACQVAQKPLYLL